MKVAKEWEPICFQTNEQRYSPKQGKHKLVSISQLPDSPLAENLPKQLSQPTYPAYNLLSRIDSMMDHYPITKQRKRSQLNQ